MRGIYTDIFSSKIKIIMRSWRTRGLSASESVRKGNIAIRQKWQWKLFWSLPEACDVAPKQPRCTCTLLLPPVCQPVGTYDWKVVWIMQICLVMPIILLSLNVDRNCTQNNPIKISFFILGSYLPTSHYFLCRSRWGYPWWSRGSFSKIGIAISRKSIHEKFRSASSDTLLQAPRKFRRLYMKQYGYIDHT